MQQIVSITSQGQITIPAALRKKLALHIYNKALIRREKNKIIVEPVPDILSLGGILEDKIVRRKKIEEIMKLEEKAVVARIKTRYKTKS